MKGIGTSLVHRAPQGWMIKPMGIINQKSFDRQRTKGDPALKKCLMKTALQSHRFKSQFSKEGHPWIRHLMHSWQMASGKEEYGGSSSVPTLLKLQV